MQEEPELLGAARSEAGNKARTSASAQKATETLACRASVIAASANGATVISAVIPTGTAHGLARATRRNANVANSADTTPMLNATLGP